MFAEIQSLSGFDYHTYHWHKHTCLHTFIVYSDVDAVPWLFIGQLSLFTWSTFCRLFSLPCLIIMAFFGLIAASMLAGCRLYLIYACFTPVMSCQHADISFVHNILAICRSYFVITCLIPFHFGPMQVYIFYVFVHILSVHVLYAVLVQVISRLYMPYTSDELHHTGWNACSSCYDDPSKTRDKMIMPCLDGDRVYVVDMGVDPREPRLYKVRCKDI